MIKKINTGISDNDLNNILHVFFFKKNIRFLRSFYLDQEQKGTITEVLILI